MNALPDKENFAPANRREWPRAAFAAMICANVLLSFGPWMVRLADVGPVASGFWRLALAAPLLLVLTRVARQPIRRMPGAVALLVVCAGLFFAADLASWHAGILHTRMANATLFGNIGSFIFAAYGFLIARRLPRRGEAAALLLAAAGAALLLGRSYELSPQYLLGDLLCVLAGLFYVAYFIAIERVRATLQPLPALAVATAAGAAALLLFLTLSGTSFRPQDWTPLLLLALSSQVFGQGLMVFALGELSPVIVGLGLLIQPVVAATIGWTVYGERLAWPDLAGAAAIAAALVLVRRKA